MGEGAAGEKKRRKVGERRSHQLKKVGKKKREIDMRSRYRGEIIEYRIKGKKICRKCVVSKETL